MDCSARLWDASLAWSIAQIGVVEHGENDGKEIRFYLRSVGLSAGNPYCAAGQYCSFAVNANGERVPLLRTGLASAMFNNAKTPDNYADVQAPQAGDLIFWRFSRKVTGHVERIITVGRAGWVENVAYNSGGSNPRDGQGVKRTKRNIKFPLGRMELSGFIGRRT